MFSLIVGTWYGYIVALVSWFRFTLQERKNEKRCRDGTSRRTQTREDIKLKVKYKTSIIHSYVHLFSQQSKNVGMGL